MTKKNYYLAGIILVSGIISACVPVGGTGSGSSNPTVSPAPTISPSPAAAWSYVGGVAGISESEADYVSLAIDRQTGLIAVAYQDQAVQGKLSVQGFQLNGTSWAYLGNQGITTGSVNYVSLAISPNSSMFVAFQIFSNNSTESSGWGNVYHYNGTTWTWYTHNDGTRDYPSLGIATNIGLAVPQNNIPYMVYSLGVSPYLGISFRSIGGWAQRTFTPVNAIYDQIAFTPNVSNTDMFIAIKDADYNNSISVFNSPESYTTLTPLGVRGFTYNRVYYVSLAVNGDGIPYVAFEDSASNDKLTVMYYNGAGGWQYVGGAPGISAGKATFVSLDLDKDGSPYVAYQDLSTGMNGRLVVQRYINNKWSIIAQGISIGQANYISLKNNPLTNKPVVAFQDSGLGNLLSVMQYNGQ